ncbi:hypothetical protein JWG40_15495 [Leptospira sp. 201903074]|uniref:hypothetical protein n=1 Tax=Leptospira abararensis TaxID=2810036 RepID=UPI001965722E|nr:hypothetical protein [Leptospira abararensis]MBM9548431.1 hypothetical protein [Leptospira abararensis]
MNKYFHLALWAVIFTSLEFCYEYKFNSIIKVKIDKILQENSNINVIFGDEFLIRNGYNRAMNGISKELVKCNTAYHKISVKTFEYKFLHYRSEDRLPLNERKVDMNLTINSFEDISDEITEAELVAYSEHRNDLLFRIRFNMIRSLAPIYKTYYYRDPGVDSGTFLGKEICNIILENNKNLKLKNKN